VLCHPAASPTPRAIVLLLAVAHFAPKIYSGHYSLEMTKVKFGPEHQPFSGIFGAQLVKFPS